MVRSLQKNQMLKYWKFQEHQKLICCFSNALVSTTDSKRTKEALYFLTYSVGSFSRPRTWKRVLSLILIQSVHVIQLQDLNTVMSACWDFLSLVNSGHFLNFKLNYHTCHGSWVEMVTSLLLGGVYIESQTGWKLQTSCLWRKEIQWDVKGITAAHTFAPALTQSQIISYGDAYSSRIFIMNLFLF